MTPRSKSFAQGSPIKIGSDQSKATKAETFAWLRQRVPELGSFKTDVYDTVTTHAPGTTWPPLTITILTTVHQQRFDFKWIAENGCEVQYDINSGGSTDYYRYNIPLQELDPMSFVVSPSGGEPLAPRPIWDLQFSAGGTRTPIHSKPDQPDAHPGARRDWSHRADLAFGDQESAERVGRALKHAAILCGARVDPF